MRYDKISRKEAWPCESPNQINYLLFDVFINAGKKIHGNDALNIFNFNKRAFG